MTPEEIRELELEENEQRVDLSDFETSKKRLKALAGERVKPAHGEPVSKGGRGKKGGDRAAAKAAGIDRETARRAETHVEIAEQFPVFKGEAWSQGRVLAAGK